MLFNWKFVFCHLPMLSNGKFAFCYFPMLFNGMFAFCHFPMLFNGNLRIEKLGGTYGRTDVHTYRTKSSYSTGHRPLGGRCPKSTYSINNMHNMCQNLLLIAGLATTSINVLGTCILIGLFTACETFLSQAFGEKNYKVTFTFGKVLWKRTKLRV